MRILEIMPASVNTNTRKSRESCQTRLGTNKPLKNNTLESGPARARRQQVAPQGYSRRLATQGLNQPAAHPGNNQFQAQKGHPKAAFSWVLEISNYSMTLATTPAPAVRPHYSGLPVLRPSARHTQRAIKFVPDKFVTSLGGRTARHKKGHPKAAFSIVLEA
jgi:hypothetical protein